MKLPRWRYFVLGPVIVLLAFSLHSKAALIGQIAAGILYTSLGFLEKER